jgi:hypothetical protein
MKTMKTAPPLGYPNKATRGEKHAMPYGNRKQAYRQALALACVVPKADNLGLTSKPHLTFLIEWYTA